MHKNVNFTNSYVHVYKTKPDCFRQPETNNSLIFRSKHTAIIKICELFGCKKLSRLGSIDRSKPDCEINEREMGSLQGECIKDIFIAFIFLLKMGERLVC